MSSPSPALLELMSKVIDGDASFDDLLSQMEASQQTQGNQGPSPAKDLAVDAVSSLPGATVDLGRGSRCGFGEVIYGEGKSAQQCIDIARQLVASSSRLLVTRIDEIKAKALQAEFPQGIYNEAAGVFRIGKSESLVPGKVINGALDVKVALLSDGTVRAFRHYEKNRSGSSWVSLCDALCFNSYKTIALCRQKKLPSKCIDITPEYRYTFLIRMMAMVKEYINTVIAEKGGVSQSIQNNPRL